MKPFLCVDLTNNKKNQEENGKEFIVKTISAATSQTMEKVAEEVAKVNKKKGLPLPLTIIQLLCAVFGFAIFRGLLTSDVTMSEAYSNAPGIFWFAGGAWACFALLFLYGRHRKKKTSESEENIIAECRADSICQTANMELGVPSNAVDVDIITFAYKSKKGKPIPRTKGAANSISKDSFSFRAFFGVYAQAQYIYENFSYKVFTENGNLCIADTENKYCIPANEIKGIHTVNTRIVVPMWNKSLSYNEGMYKQFKISCNDNGINFKPYHILELEHNGQQWGIYFPCYELPFFEYITGMKAD